MDLEKIKTPMLLLDQKKCEANIKFMADKANSLGIEFRPHFKTHQSKIIGNWFKKQEVKKITVSSFKMAEYFAADGWNDITVAFPVNIREIGQINTLSANINLNIVLENIESTEFLITHLKNKVGFFIKIDTGYGRTGVSFDIFLIIDKILKSAELSENLVFKGFLSHSGNTYYAKNIDEIREIHFDSLQKLALLKKQYAGRYSDLIISVGDTPSCSTLENFDGIGEIRPGNFVFYDLMQYNLGSCAFDQVAVAMACPVVAKHADRDEIIIYGGAVHFSKEFITINGVKVYGMVVELTESGWKQMDENNYLVKISQEHGTIKASQSLFEKIKVGGLVGIIPVHSCLTANLMGKYVTTHEEIIDHFSGK